MVTLGEDPGIAARDDAEVDGGPAAPALLSRVRVGNVPFERDAVAARPEADRPRRQPVHAVRSDQHRRTRGRAPEANRRLPLTELERGRPYAVAKLRARGDGLLGKVCVEPVPLRHQHQRPLPAPLDAGPVAQAELDPVDDVLDDRIDGDRELAHRAVGETAAAGLVAREAGSVEQKHPRVAAGEAQRRRRAGRPGPDDDRIEPLHSVIVSLL